MKRNILTTLILACAISSFLLVSGCSKKNVVAPGVNTNGDGSAMSGGNDINYPSAGGGFSEDNLPAEGTLDDSTNGWGGQAGANDPRHMADQQSDEYKKAHGRSSANLSPIYFDFDQAGVSPSMTNILIQNADYLNSKPGSNVIIEGNSDERGTNEYNLALGERRAINTQQYLINLGVDPARMRTVSFGEEKPLFMGQDQEAYQYNRRVDFGLE
ncbi:MAG: peptidoglycan-associated lipoprotein [Desulforhopalus sp.]|jgi:peptidoglycan-associated lipoprotein